MAQAGRDWYTVLGVAPSASVEVIRTRYRHLCRQHHPDKQPQAHDEGEVDIALVTEAWRVLSDPDLRQRFDAQRQGAPVSLLAGRLS